MNKTLFTLIFALLTLGAGVFSTAHARSSGNLYQGLTRSMPGGRTAVPYRLEITFNKTAHLIFPASIRYADLGSTNAVAAKAESAENILRVKASIKDFEIETNMSVICTNDSFYAFNVRYIKEPEKLSLGMVDFLHSDEGNLPSNEADIYFKELDNEAPTLVWLLMSTIHEQGKRLVKHMPAEQFGMQLGLKAIYAHNGLLYFHMSIYNTTNIRYQIDYVAFKVVDKATTTQTAIQETILQPLRAYNDLAAVAPRSELRTIYALESFLLPKSRILGISLYGLNGGRTLAFTVGNKDLVRTRAINSLELRF